jgi:hypothetical protein
MTPLPLLLTPTPPPRWGELEPELHTR